MTISQKVEIALAPDRTADPVSWTWTDVTPTTRARDLTIKRGRSEGATLAEPGSFTIPMYNGDGRYSPRNPESTYYPNIVRGMPVRHSSTFGARQLYTTGAAASRASTPDAASLDITGDISGIVEFGSPVRHPLVGTMVYAVAGKYVTAGNQRSWFIDLLASGNFRFSWSTDGTSANSHVIAGTLPIPRPDSGPLSIGWWFDVNLAGTSRVLHIYYLRGTLTELLADPAAALHETITETGTTSIFASTAALDVGGVNAIYSAGVFENYPGMIRRFQLRNGDLSTGTVAAFPNFTIQTAAATTFADTAAVPKTWTINSPAAITAAKTTMIGELTGNHLIWPANAVPDTARSIWEVSGILRRLRQGNKPLRSSLYRLITGRINTDTVVAYWPFEDGSGSTFAASGIAGQSAASTSNLRFASDATFTASQPLPTISSGQPGSFIAPIIDAPASTTWRAELFYKIPTPAAAGSGTTLIVVTTNGTVAQFAVWIDDTNVNFDLKNSLGVIIASGSFSSDDRFFDVWALITLGWEQNGGNIDYEIGLVPVEGAGAGLVFGGSSAGSTAGTVGEPTSVQTIVFSGPPDGVSFGHVVVTTGNGVGWMAPADSAYVGEPATSRFYRLCREEGIPGFVDGYYGTSWADVIAADSPTRTMGPQRPLALLTLLEECATVEQGYLSECREVLGLALRGYRSLIDQTPAITLTTQVTNPFESADDDQRLINDMTAKRVLGSSARYVDEASVAASETYDDEKEYNVERDTVLAAYAGWRVIRALWPEMRYPQIAAKITDPTDALLDAWFDSCVGDVVAANLLPAEHPTTTIAQIMEGYSQTISPFVWEFRINGSPAGPFTVGVLDDDPASPDTDLARLDSAGSTLSAGVTTTATSLSVAVAATSKLWTTAANERPFDIVIGGEQMTVTNLTGAASPQTFTVTRSVNGVVKSHSSGAEVRVFYPIRLTL